MKEISRKLTQLMLFDKKKKRGILSDNFSTPTGLFQNTPITNQKILIILLRRLRKCQDVPCDVPPFLPPGIALNDKTLLKKIFNSILFNK